MDEIALRLDSLDGKMDALDARLALIEHRLDVSGYAIPRDKAGRVLELGQKVKFHRHNFTIVDFGYGTAVLTATNPDGDKVKIVVATKDVEVIPQN